MNDAWLTELFARDADVVLRTEKAAQAREGDAPVPFTPSFEKRMDDLCARMRTGKYRRVYGKARVMLIAAIVMAFMATSVGAGVRFIIPRMERTTEYDLFHADGGVKDTLIGDIQPHYIPEKFTILKEKVTNPYVYSVYFESPDGESLSILIRSSGSEYYADNETTNVEQIEIDGQTFFLFTDESFKEILTFDVDHSYSIAWWGQNVEFSDLYKIFKNIN